PPPPTAPRQVVMPAPKRLDAEEASGSKAKTIALVAAVLVVLPVAGYFAFTWAGGAQKRFNEARAKNDDPGMVGGEVGHVAELYQVMEMTDRMSVRGAEEEYQRRRGGRAAGSDRADPPGPESLPVATATWSLEGESMPIPKGRLGGLVAGSNFIGRSVVLYTGNATPILALRQNDGPSSEAELMVYLRIKPGEKLEGRTWTVAKDESSGIPQVVKRWRTGSRAAPQMKSFNGGYAMKLEFGKLDEGNLPGQLYLALPDAERSVVGGAFTAEIRVLNTAQNQARPAAGAGFEE
ncbi:MAG TPA: hypothetical protein VNH84_11860, partial [Candidatus Saccharimonadales bacterium]|nr:hypothetical protein [Candidatus Saccharimonadales bacterium]